MKVNCTLYVVRDLKVHIYNTAYICSVILPVLSYVYGQCYFLFISGVLYSRVFMFLKLFNVKGEVDKSILYMVSQKTQVSWIGVPIRIWIVSLLIFKSVVICQQLWLLIPFCQILCHYVTYLYSKTLAYS